MSRSRHAQCSVGRGCPVCGDAGEARRDREEDAFAADVREGLEQEPTLAEVDDENIDACRGCGDSIPRGQGTCGALECGGRDLSTMFKKIKIDLSDPDTRATWEAALEAKREVESWPAWKRGEAVNQCMGCQAGWPLNKYGKHIVEGGYPHESVACTKERYE